MQMIGEFGIRCGAEVMGNKRTKKLHEKQVLKCAEESCTFCNETLYPANPFIDLILAVFVLCTGAIAQDHWNYLPETDSGVIRGEY